MQRAAAGGSRELERFRAGRRPSRPIPSDRDLMGRRPARDLPRASVSAGATVTPLVGGVLAAESSPANFSSKQLA
jgi:hypothetical protein